MTNNKTLEEIELYLLLEAIYRCYGWDFRDYAPASLKRRIRKCTQEEGLKNISGLQEKVLHDPACMGRVLNGLSIGVTAMFRDPGFFLAFRKRVAPLLRNEPFVRIWHAGVSTGEEVYSLAILLQEEQVYEKTRVYGTDMNEAMLKKAKSGVFPLSAMKEYTENYIRAGGTMSFSNYYRARYENAIFKNRLKTNICWAQHNLVTDASFNEFHVILCRNVLIYFNRALAERVHRLFYQSLSKNGVLVLGNKESLRFTPFESCYEELDEEWKIYRRVK